MALDNHTALPTGAELTAQAFNTIFEQLDAAIKKNNFGATTDPTVNDDLNDGYSVGSRWANIATDSYFVALDVTVGTAVWVELGGFAFPASITQDFTINGQLFVNVTGGGTGVDITHTGGSASSTAAELALNSNDGSAMASSDRLGQILFAGQNGSGVAAGAYIIARANEAWNGSQRGSRVEVYTTQNGTNNLLLALTVRQDQGISVVGEAEIDGALNHDGSTAGFFGVAPVSQQGATVDLGTVLSNLGLRAAGVAYPLSTAGAVNFTGTIGLGGQITLADAINIALNTATGTKLGTSGSQKLGLWGATPVTQRSAYTLNHVGTTRTHAAQTSQAITYVGTPNTTLQDVTGSHNQGILNDNFSDLAEQINRLQGEMSNLKSVMNSVLGDSAAVGISAP